MTHFLGKFNRRHGRRLTGFTQRAVDAVLTYDWPGNIRELENVIERGVILAAEGAVIDAPQLFTSGEHFDAGAVLRQQYRQVGEDRSRPDLLEVQAADIDTDRVSNG